MIKDNFILKEVYRALKLSRKSKTEQLVFCFEISNSIFFKKYFAYLTNTKVFNPVVVYRSLTGDFSTEASMLYKKYNKITESTKIRINKIVTRYDNKNFQIKDYLTLNKIPEVFKERIANGIKLPDTFYKEKILNSKKTSYYNTEDEYGYIPNYRAEEVLRELNT